jgi:hypothetical protein
MAISAGTVWEVDSATGDNSNGGGCDTSLGGTDYTYGGTQAVTSYTDLVIDATTNTKITSSAHPFNSTHVGNIINVTGGTGFTVQRVQIISVTSGVATCDKSVGTLSSTGGVGKLGGSLADPGYACGAMINGNNIYIKYSASPYLITTSTSNVAGGVLAPLAGVTGNLSRIIGYTVTRGDVGTRPVLRLSGVTNGTLVTLTTQTTAETLDLDGNNLTGSKGISGSVFGEAHRCIVRNCLGNAYTTIRCRFCLATGNTGASFVTTDSLCCTAYANIGNTAAFVPSTAGQTVNCYAINNTGGTNAHGFNWTSNGAFALNCVAYGNGGNGFQTTGGGTAPSYAMNCIAENNTGIGFNSTIATYVFRLYDCAAYNNTGGNFNNFLSTINLFNAQTASAFTNPAGLDFSLNNTPGGGANLRGQGAPTSSGALVIPGLSTLSYIDVGGAQHQDIGSGGTGGVSRARLQGGL